MHECGLVPLSVWLVCLLTPTVGKTLILVFKIYSNCLQFSFCSICANAHWSQTETGLKCISVHIESGLQIVGLQIS